MRFKYILQVLLLLCEFCMLMVGVASADGVVEFWCSVDQHRRPLPGGSQGSTYNDMDGNRGCMSDSAAAVVEFEEASASSYRGRVAELKTGSRTWFGMYYGLGHHTSDEIALDPAAVYSPVIRQSHQPKITAVRIVVNDVNAPQPRTPKLLLKIELKGFSATGQIIRKVFVFGDDEGERLAGGVFPRTFIAEFDPAGVGPIGVVTWVLDNAIAGDSIEIDALALRVEMPELAPRQEAFLTSLGMLLANYDGASAMVNDKAHDRNKALENVTATGKLAKILAMAVVTGLADAQRAKAEIAKIAEAFINVLPKGPPGRDRLLAHFTRNGGAEKVPGSEWASGDTAYALLDLLVALKMIGDASGRIDAVLGVLREIDWPALQADDGAFHHGYTSAGELIPYKWNGFGAEALGVLLAAHAGDGLAGTMGPPPTDNGSGFIMHAGYPIAPTGIDKYANNWLALRKAEIARQIAWYTHADRYNAFYAGNHLYGLSAAEAPDCRNYTAYGIGGKYSGPRYKDPSDRDVVVGHYCAMASSLEPQAAERMYAKLKALGLLSPLNNVESISFDPRTSRILANSLKGSWNLALQAEGWALSLPGVAAAVEEAFHGVAALDDAWRTYFPPVPPGDIDRSRAVDLHDFARLGFQWRQHGCDQCLWCAGADINNDATVNFTDAEILFDNWLARRLR